MQAWVFKGAREESSSSGIYYSLAALYGLPWVFSNLQVTGFTGTLLVLGAIQMQARCHPATSSPCVMGHAGGRSATSRS